MILDIPPHIEQMMTATAQAQGMSVQDWALTTLQKGIAQDEQAYYDWFYEHHFDKDMLDKAINSPKTEIPKGLAKDFNAFHQWMLGKRV